MTSEEMIDKLSRLKSRLFDDVGDAYKTNEAYGRERFESWVLVTKAQLNQGLSLYADRLAETVNRAKIQRRRGSSPSIDFSVRFQQPCEALLESLIRDLKSGDVTVAPPLVAAPSINLPSSAPPLTPTMKQSNKVFIVHGRDSGIRHEVSNYTRAIGLEPVILAETVSGGTATIFDKLLKNTDVGFAIVIYSADDLGNLAADAAGSLRNRARQNVIFEHGLLVAKLTKERVVAIIAKDIEIPSDLNGVVYHPADNWKLSVAKELKYAGYDIDVSKIPP